MLVLTRKREQTVQIGPQITVTILRIKGRSVQIGIQAPPSAKILRGELVGNSAETARRRAPRQRIAPEEPPRNSVGPASQLSDILVLRRRRARAGLARLAVC